MPKRSAGILLYRRRGDLELLLVHPGGPGWVKKDLGAWSIPKGEYDEGNDPLTVAPREREGETGRRSEGKFIPVGALVRPERKVVTALALQRHRHRARRRR